MPIVQIAPVSRGGMKLLICLFGMSETGKTYSAIKLMGGIEPRPEKRGLLDCEGGERGRAYMDAIEGGYLYGALTPPFTPARYMEAINDFIVAGVTTLVIDSSSHVWFAEGGVLDMVENSSVSNDMAKWAAPKRALGKFTNKVLSCGLHILLCARGKQPLLEDVNPKGKKIYVLGPVVPVQEKNLRYDMTIMAQMLGDGHFTLEKAHGGKCPGPLRPVFAGETMSEAMGAKLIAWIGGQDVSTPAQRALIARARDAAGTGTESLRLFWQSLGKDEKTLLHPMLENLKSTAAAIEAEEADQFAPTPLPSTSAMPGGVRMATEGGEVRVEDELTARARRYLASINGAGNAEAFHAVARTEAATALVVELATAKHPLLTEIREASQRALASFDVDGEE